MAIGHGNTRPLLDPKLTLIGHRDATEHLSVLLRDFRDPRHRLTAP